jgi:hypothetical protein
MEIISITSCSKTSISERTFKHLQSKSGKTLFSSFELDMEEKYLLNLDELKSANGKLYWKTMNMLIKNENSSNETPPLSDPQNDFKLSHESIYFDSVSTDFTLRKVLQKRSRIRISLLKVESNQTLSSFLIITSLVPQNDFKLSHESIEKAEILNKYFSSISNLNDENKVLPDFDCRCLNVLSYNLPLADFNSSKFSFIFA